MDYSSVLVGVCYSGSDNKFFLKQEKDNRIESLDSIFGKFSGVDVQVHIKHSPLVMDVGKPGFGCCGWVGQECPAGHHTDPTFLLCFDVSGVLIRDPESGWCVNSQILPLNQLPGHRCEILVVRNEVGKNDSQLVNMLKDVDDLESLFKSLQDFMK
jgi:hypothetical protein